jgi:prephenate dehydrogenase
MYKIIGAGLIGGAIAKQLNNKHLDFVIFDADPTTAEKMKNELHHGVVLDSVKDVVLFQNSNSGPDVGASVGTNESDIIFLAVPLRAMKETIEELAKYFDKNSNTIIADVGSTKRLIVETIDNLDLNEFYIGAHPMAGNHLSGFDASTKDLLIGASWALTPSMAIPREMIDFLEEHIVHDLGGFPLEINSAIHDDTTALISHLPHIFATEIANLVENYDKRELALKLAAGSYKDAVRVAAEDPRRTEAMVLENSKHLAKYLRQVATDFSDIATVLEAIDDSTERLESDNTNAPEFIRNFFDNPETVRNWRKSLDR